MLSQDAGVTHVWLPPPSQSVADQGYLPGQLYNLDSKYGNKEQLQDLCKELKAAGIVPIADIVINHRCADEKGEDGVYNTFRSAQSGYISLLCRPQLSCVTSSSGSSWIPPAPKCLQYCNATALPQAWQDLNFMHRDDIDHKGEKVDWGKWAITCDDPDFGGEGNEDTGSDYGPAPGNAAIQTSTYASLIESQQQVLCQFLTASGRAELWKCRVVFCLI